MSLNLDLLASEDAGRKLALISYSGSSPNQAVDLERALDALWPGEESRLVYFLNIFGPFPPPSVDGTGLAEAIEPGVLSETSNRSIVKYLEAIRCEHVMICDPMEGEVAWKVFDKYVELGTRRFAEYILYRHEPLHCALAFFESTSVGLDCVLPSARVSHVGAAWIQMLLSNDPTGSR